jgi:hypothetical protein
MGYQVGVDEKIPDETGLCSSALNVVNGWILHETNPFVSFHDTRFKKQRRVFF